MQAYQFLGSVQHEGRPLFNLLTQQLEQHELSALLSYSPASRNSDCRRCAGFYLQRGDVIVTMSCNQPFSPNKYNARSFLCYASYLGAFRISQS